MTSVDKIAEDKVVEKKNESSGEWDEVGDPTERVREEMCISWYHRLLIKVLKTGKMPKSIGIIMDGNRRYATS
jgi:hypothetical protein